MMIADSTVWATSGLASVFKDKLPKNAESPAVSSDDKQGDDGEDAKAQKMKMKLIWKLNKMSKFQN